MVIYWPVTVFVLEQLDQIFTASVPLSRLRK
jgi:hypothetical protein